MTESSPIAAVMETAVPAPSVIRAQLPGATFHDAYTRIDPAPARNALQTWLDVVTHTPGWVQGLMELRNRLVRLVGLKALGQLGDLDHDPKARNAAYYRVGDRLGIFKIRHISEAEVVLGQDDRHLNVQVSLHKSQCGDQPMLTMSTVVHEHNALGHAYMAVVKPFHRRIVRHMLARVPVPRHGPQS